MADFPIELTLAVDGVTEIWAKHLNNLEAKVGEDDSEVVTSLDYLLKNPLSSDPGHVHTLAAGATDVTALASELNLLDLSGLTTGHVLRATGADTAAWGAIAASDLPSAIDAAKIANGLVSNTEFQYLDGVTSAIQTQLDGKIGVTDSRLVTVSTNNQPVANYNATASFTPTVHQIAGSIEYGFLYSTYAQSAYNHSSINGSAFTAAHSGTGVISNMNTALFNAGLYSNTGSVTALSILTVGSLYAVASDKTVGTVYGLKIETMKQDFVTTAYGIYQEGAFDSNYLAGRVGIGIIPISPFILSVSKTYDLADITSTNSWYTTPIVNFNCIIDGNSDVNSSSVYGSNVNAYTKIQNTTNNLSKLLVSGLQNTVENYNPTLSSIYGLFNVVRNFTNSSSAVSLIGNYSLARNEGYGSFVSQYGIFSNAGVMPPVDTTFSLTSLYGVFAACNISGLNVPTSVSVTSAYGVLGQISSSNNAAGTGTTTVTSAYALYARAYARYTGGVITNAYGLYVENGYATYNTGVITNQYGIYIEDQTLGGTLKFNIYSAGNGINYFGGLVGIGTTTFGTSAAKVLAIGNGTAPTTAPADIVQLWAEDIGAAAGKAGLHMVAESGTAKLIVVGVIIKTDTGDPAQVHEGLMAINTYDNNVKVYADGGWRLLATW